MARKQLQERANGMVKLYDKLPTDAAHALTAAALANTTGLSPAFVIETLQSAFGVSVVECNGRFYRRSNIAADDSDNSIKE